MLKQWASYALIGLVCGFVTSLVGVSTSLFLVPAMVFVLGWSQRTAQGTALAVSLPPVSILAALDYYRHGEVHLHAAMIMATGIFIGGYFGGRLAQKVSQKTLCFLFAAVLLLIGIKMLLLSHRVDVSEQLLHHLRMHEYIVLFILAFLVGIFGGMVGVGGAIVLEPILIYLMAWPEKLADGTMVAMLMPPVSLLAVLHYYRAGEVKVPAAAIIALFVIPAAWIGAQTANHLPVDILSRVFAVLALLVGLKMLQKARTLT